MCTKTDLCKISLWLKSLVWISISLQKKPSSYWSLLSLNFWIKLKDRVDLMESDSLRFKNFGLARLESMEHFFRLEFIPILFILFALDCSRDEKKSNWRTAMLGKYTCEQKRIDLKLRYEIRNTVEWEHGRNSTNRIK